MMHMAQISGWELSTLFMFHIISRLPLSHVEVGVIYTANTKLERKLINACVHIYHSLLDDIIMINSNYELSVTRQLVYSEAACMCN